MSTIVTRAGKGSALTHTEVDANFTNLNTDKIEAAQSVTLTNKTISGSNNTLSNIGNSSLTNSSVTIGSTSVSLGSTATTISGLTLSSPTVNTPTLSGGTINNATIGASTPSSGAFTTLSATGVTTVQAGTAAAPAITTSGDTNTGVFFPAADTVAIGTGGTERLRVDSAGNAGLGVTPSAWASGWKAIDMASAGVAGSGIQLQATSNAFSNGSNWIYKTTNSASMYQQINGVHSWFTAASGTAGNAITFTTAMTLDASGNLGLGTTSLTNSAGYSTISVSGSTGGQIAFQSGGVSKHFIYGTSTDLNIYNSVSGVLGFWTNATERARITSGGRLNIGTTGGSASRLEIAGTESMCIFINESSTDATYKTTMSFTDSNGSVRGTIKVNNSATQYNTSSDYRLKENVQPMTGALAKVAALKPCTYTWKVDGELGEGFIAHELQEVAPYAVTGEKDGEQMQGVDYGKLTPILTAALQEAIAKIETLQARVAALEAK